MIRLATIIACVVATGSARADWQYTQWGMTPEQVAGRSSGDVKVLPKAERTPFGDDHTEIAAQGTFRDGPRVLSVGFMFDNKTGLECVLYNALGDDVEPVKTGLIKKYGPGKASEFGPTHTLNWVTPEKIELTIGDRPLAAVVMHCRPGD